jgi:site-specific recombinase XerD
MKKTSGNFKMSLSDPKDLDAREAASITQMTYNACVLTRREKSKNGGLTPLYLRITYNKQRAEISLNTYINPDIWDGSKLRGTGKETKAINETLQITTIKLREIFNELRDKNAPITANLLKDRLLGKDSTRQTIERKKTILDACNYHIKELEIQAGKGIYTIATAKKYRYLSTHLKNFMHLEYQQADMPVEKIDLYFLKQFFSYLLTDRNIEDATGKVIEKKACENNSAVKYLKNLKTIVNVALGFGWLTVNPYMGFKAKLEKVEQDHLTEDEFNVIINKHIDNERLASIKDFFSFQCLTGLAYVDMEKITKNDIVIDIEGNKWLSIDRQKSRTACRIPLLPMAETIIKKYAGHPVCINTGKLLPVISNQNYNQYLKELAAICNISKHLTTHVGRRTFASLALNNGVPAETLIKIIGHANFNTLHLYAKHDDKKINNDIQTLKQKFK